MILTFLGDAIGLDFCFLLLVRLNGCSIGVTLHFGGKNSGSFCALKIPMGMLVLSLGKNVSIREAKSACPIFTPSL